MKRFMLICALLSSVAHAQSTQAVGPVNPLNSFTVPSCITAAQVTITGNLRVANGMPQANSILTLIPSQTGFIAGCGVNLQQAATCSTSSDGSVVQIPDPQTPTVNTIGGAGILSSGTYYTFYEFYNSSGVTLRSPETITILSASGSLVVNPPSSGIPSTATGMDVFIGTTSGGETLQGQTTGAASFVQATPLTSGSTPASNNTTACVVVANDAVWPTGTGYKVSLVDSDGDQVPGFPMQWQLMGPGTTINLSNGMPYYHGVVTYPAPILASPQNHGNQSITGNLSVQGLLINGASGINGQCLGTLGTSFNTPFACITALPTPTGTCTPNGYFVAQINGVQVHVASCQ